MVGDDDEVLEQVQREVERAIGLPADQIVGALRSVVADAMLATHPDGSWPEAMLIREVVAMAVDSLDSVLAELGSAAVGLESDDRRWLDACRAMGQSIELLEDMLDDLRAGLRPPGPSTSTAR